MRSRKDAESTSRHYTSGNFAAGDPPSGPAQGRPWLSIFAVALAVVAGILLLSPTPHATRSAHGDQAAELSSPSASASGGVGSPSLLQQFAERGQFADLLEALRQDPTAVRVDHADQLIEDLERHLEHAQTRREARREDYREAIEQMSAQRERGQVDEALITAIEANGLADDPEAMLETPAVQDLVDQAEARARAATDDGRWLEALNLYRSLDLLFEDDSPYGKNLKTAERHVRLLRLYAPDDLQAMHMAREKRKIARREALREKGLLDETNASTQDNDRHGAEAESDPELEPELLRLGEETWEQKLTDINMSVLRQTLAYSYRKHVSDPGYAGLLRGALDALIVMSDTPELASAFPSFGDEDKLRRFRDGLNAMREGVAEQADADDEAEADAQASSRKRSDASRRSGGGRADAIQVFDGQVFDGEDELNFLDAARLIDEVVSLNEKTVQLPEAVLVHEMTDGAMTNLDDFSAVIWPREKEHFSRNTQGKFFGVGIQISRRNSRLVVVSPLEETPAQRAGIKAEDIIATVDGRPTDSWTLEQAVREITGPKGTKVTLGIERAGEPDLLKFEIRRAEIEIRSIRGWRHLPGGGWDFYVDPASRIGYVRLSQFVPQTAENLDEAIRQMQEDRGLNALILDLRFNPGGLLGSAIEVADRFITTGRIVSTVSPLGQRTSARARPNRTYDEFPVAVLINQGSASASEIVAGALQDYDRGIVIGTRSFGKGSVQDLFHLDGDKAFLKLTTQHYQLPNGRIIHRKPDAKAWGIKPDLAVDMTSQQVADLIEFRQKADVLRDGPEADNDSSAEQEDGADSNNGGLDPDDADDADDAEPGAQATDPPPDVDTILKQSMDPQLEAALLVLKTQLVADRLTLAER